MPLNLKHRIKVWLGREPRIAPIKEQSAPFDAPSFRTKTTRLEDSFLREHSLNLIDKGYTVIPNSVDVTLLDTASQDFQSWKQRNHERLLEKFFRVDGHLDRVVNIHAGLPVFRELFTKNRAIAVQDYLFQRETSLFTSLLFEAGSTQNLHRDTPLFWTNPANMYFGTWVALESTDERNGPLIVVPGSHKLPLLDRDAIAREKYTEPSQIQEVDDDLWQIYQQKINDFCNLNCLSTIALHVNKGDTIIWHPMLVHGGAPIVDELRTRLSLVMHTTPKGVPVFHNDVFFDAAKPVTNRAPWSYQDIGSRSMVHHGCLSIGHAHPDFDYFSSLK